MPVDSAPARPRTRRPRDARIEEIVATAARLYAVRGFRNTSIVAVAKEVGMTDAGILHHFPTKHDLLFAVLDWDTQNQADMFRRLLQAGGIAALRKIADWGTVMEADPELLGLNITLSAEALEPDARLHDYFVARYRVVRRWFVRAVEQAIADGDITPGTEPEAEALALIALLDGLRLHWFFTDRSRPLAELVRTSVDAHLDRLAPRGPSGRRAPDA
jgi:AcrR family transcriptional regulator